MFYKALESPIHDWAKLAIEVAKDVEEILFAHLLNISATTSFEKIRNREDHIAVAE